MPIYEYRCASCGNEHEALQKFTEPPLTTCPACHQNTLTKLLSAAGFKLKGSGWYATDFKNGSKPAAKTDGKPKEPGTETKTDTQAETKSKAETKSDGAGASESKPAETKSGSSTPAAPDTSH